MRYVIIGGVAAGMSAASKIARLQPGADITVFEAGEHISYGACGLPYYISGDNADERKLFARSVQDFQKAGISVQLRHRVTKVQPEDHRVMARCADTGDLIIREYDKLLVATGASAAVPDISGVELPGVHTLKTVEDARAIIAAAQTARRVVIAGGGYIGVELCEAMVKLGKEVTLLEGAERILTGFAPQLSALAQEELSRHGVELRLGERLQAVEGAARVEAAITDRGAYPCDLLILALGLRPNTAFLRDAGVVLAPNGAVVVDREQRTSAPDIYAAGDCALTYHRVAMENTYIPLGTVANKCGRIAGGNMAGRRDKFQGALGSAAIKVMGWEFARTGLSAAEAQAQRLDFGEATVTASDHPRYYPDPTPVYFQLIYHRGSGRMLGACAGGEKGAVLRIDAAAAAITGGLTLEELGQADFCYAPPFAGVWDVLNIAANFAEGKRNKNE